MAYKVFSVALILTVCIAGIWAATSDGLHNRLFSPDQPALEPQETHDMLEQLVMEYKVELMLLDEIKRDTPGAFKKIAEIKDKKKAVTEFISICRQKRNKCKDAFYGDLKKRTEKAVSPSIKKYLESCSENLINFCEEY